MLPILLVRILAGLYFVLFVASLVALRAARSGSDPGTPEVAAERAIPRAVRLAWPLLIILPFLFLGLAAAVPEAVVGTVLNLSLPGDTAIQLVGAALYVPAGLLLLASARALGRHMRAEILVSRDHELVTRGPYARIRHPVYTSGLLLSLSVALLLLHSVLIAAWLVYLALAVYRARAEEALLASEEGFGARYRAYMERTGRFLPRWGRRAGTTRRE